MRGTPGVRGGIAPDHRPRLGEEQVIGRRRALLRQLLHVRALRERPELVALLDFQYTGNRPARRSLAAGSRSPRAWRSWASPRGMPGLSLLQVLLRHGDELDHALVGLARLGAEGDDAVRDEHHADRSRARLARELAREERRELESRHRVRDDGNALAVDLADALLAVGRVGHRRAPRRRGCGRRSGAAAARAAASRPKARARRRAARGC